MVQHRGQQRVGGFCPLAGVMPEEVPAEAEEKGARTEVVGQGLPVLTFPHQGRKYLCASCASCEFIPFYLLFYIYFY